MFYIVFIFSLLFSINAKSQSVDPYAFSSHGMIIILDDGELWSFKLNSLTRPSNNLSIASTNTFLQALSYQHFPIIVTKKFYCVLRLLRLFADYAITQKSELLAEFNQAISDVQPFCNAFKMENDSKIVLIDDIKKNIQNFVEFEANKKKHWIALS